MTYSERYLAVRVASRSLCSLVQRSGRSARVLRFTVNAYARPRILRLRWGFPSPSRNDSQKLGLSWLALNGRVVVSGRSVARVERSERLATRTANENSGVAKQVQPLTFCYFLVKQKEEYSMPSQWHR